MKDAILILSIAGTLIFGYVLMGRIDVFLDRNFREPPQHNELQEPSCVLLTEDMPEEELLREIRAFRSTHENTCVLLCDPPTADRVAAKH